MVKLFLADLTKEDRIVKLSNMLVGMIVVCGRLNNDLNQGRSKILNWSFALFGKRDRRKLIAEFWKEVTERLEEGDITKDILMQLGMFWCQVGLMMLGWEVGRERKLSKSRMLNVDIPCVDHPSSES